MNKMMGRKDDLSGGGGHSCKFVHWSTPWLLGFRWGTCFEIKCPRGLYRGVSGIAYYKHHTVRARNKCKPHVHGNISRGPEQAKQLSVSSHLRSSHRHCVCMHSCSAQPGTGLYTQVNLSNCIVYDM